MLSGKKIKKTCENKLKMSFRTNKECNAWYYLNGKKITKITIPKQKGGNNTIKKGTLASMARQMKLNQTQFKDLINCPLKKNEYDQILIKMNNDQ
jgi:hypothetical protein